MKIYDGKFVFMKASATNSIHAFDSVDDIAVASLFQSLYFCQLNAQKKIPIVSGSAFEIVCFQTKRKQKENEENRRGNGI